MSREIAGYEVYDGFDEVLNAGTAYDKNYVTVKDVTLTKPLMDDLMEGNGGYVKVNKTEAIRKAKAYQAMARKYAMLARRADVKDDEGDHDDHEFMHIDHYGDEWVVKATGGIEKHFDNEDEAVDYLLSLHGHKDDKVEKDERRRAMIMRRRRAMAQRNLIARRKRASLESHKALPSRRMASIQSPRISSNSVTSDPSLKGLIR